MILDYRSQDQVQRLSLGGPVLMQGRTAFDESTGRGAGEPPKQAMDFRKIGMQRAPVQQRGIVLRAMGSRGEIRLVRRGARLVVVRSLLRYAEQADPGLPLRALVL
jgi:hypothetical protein